MPSPAKQTDRSGLEAFALAQGGYFDRRDAHEYGITDSLLRYHTRTGRFERILVTVPRPFHRTSAPFQVQLAPLPEEEVQTYKGVRVTTPARAIIDAAATGTDPTQIHKAVREALERGLVVRARSGRPPFAAPISTGGVSDDSSRRRCPVPLQERGGTPSGFRTQLLQRLRNEALRAGIPAQRLQQRIAFERLLARLPHDGEWVLKGGFAW